MAVFDAGLVSELLSGELIHGDGAFVFHAFVNPSELTRAFAAIYALRSKWCVDRDVSARFVPQA